MPSNFTSPFATAFKSAVKRGTPYNTVVENIAKRNGKTTSFVWNSLFKAGVCNRQKFNGQWVYFPCEVKKCTATNNKSVQFNCWQSFCEWCLCNGFCTPETMKKNCGSQAEFMKWCKKFWSKQFTTSTGTAKTTKSKTAKSKTAKAKTTKAKTVKAKTTKSKTTKSKTAKAKKNTTTKSYKFPKTRTTSKRRAA